MHYLMLLFCTENKDIKPITYDLVVCFYVWLGRISMPSVGGSR